MNDQINKPRMISPNLIEIDASGARIVAARRAADGRVVFPIPEERGGASGCEKILLSRRGTLWSWTVQRFRPKTPPYSVLDQGEFRPFIVGYVEFPEGIVVEGRIDAAVDSTLPAQELCMGLRMGTVIIPIFKQVNGDVIHTYAFRAERE